MRKERVLAILIAIFLVLLACLYMSSIVGASDGMPDNIYEWVRSDGSLCSAIITEGAVAIDCDCPCDSDCEFSPEPTVSPTVETPVPSETPKPKCNSGRGNGSEGSPNDCDPGNSEGHNEGGD